MKTVVAAVDFSANTAQVVHAAIKLARPMHGRVVILHVAPPPASIRDVLPAVDTVDQHARNLMRIAEEKLAELQRLFRRSYSAVDTLVCTGTATDTIVEQAKRLAAEYLVIGSHGHTAAHDLLLGSVAAGVLKAATCGVLVIPPGLPATHASPAPWPAASSAAL